MSSYVLSQMADSGNREKIGPNPLFLYINTPINHPYLLNPHYKNHYNYIISFISIKYRKRNWTRTAGKGGSPENKCKLSVSSFKIVNLFVLEIFKSRLFRRSSSKSPFTLQNAVALEINLSIGLLNGKASIASFKLQFCKYGSYRKSMPAPPWY